MSELTPDDLNYFFSISKRNLTKGSYGLVFLETRDLLGTVEFGYCSEQMFSYAWLNKKNIDLFEFEQRILSSESRRRVFLNFKDRVIFKISNEFDETIALAGRTVIKDFKPKYYNTSYDKKKHLFLYSEVKKLVVEKNYIVLVEGQTDALKLYKYNIPAVGLLSSSCSFVQFCKLIRYTPNIFICMDGDQPGIKAQRKIIEEYSRYDINLNPIWLPEGLDPDEYLNSYGSEKFKSFLKIKE